MVLSDEKIKLQPFRAELQLDCRVCVCVDKRSTLCSLDQTDGIISTESKTFLFLLVDFKGKTLYNLIINWLIKKVCRKERSYFGFLQTHEWLYR